ncbi:MAG: exodeoxyribonuclease VII large subunit [Acidobacteria bacterium]|nr:exodeoxyribonuclease VII large subunit [Acidobacteriota bacterium]
MSQTTLGLVPERRIYSVSELTGQIRDILERTFRDLWVQGEVSNFRVSPYGHYYFTLKDQTAQLRCFCHKKDMKFYKFRPEDGLQITARGALSVYEQRGEYQLVVSYLEPAGYGALQVAFEQLKERLRKEGLFEVARKRPLPLLPQRIGLVTSPRGAAVADMIRILRRRFEGLHLIVYPVRVQGEGAAEEIVEAIEYFNQAPGQPQVLIVARGGGSLEDLWAFNEEALARAIAASKIPVISAVGHETDFTIADFVADVRAPTPSAAAEMVVARKDEFLANIASLQSKLTRDFQYQVLHARQRLTELLAHRGFRRLQAFLHQQAQRADELHSRLIQALRDRAADARTELAVQLSRLTAFDLRGLVRVRALRLAEQHRQLAERTRTRLRAAAHRLEVLAGQLAQLSPLAILERGYAIVFDAEGKVISHAAAVQVGEAIDVRLHRGRLQAEVKKRETAEESS